MPQRRNPSMKRLALVLTLLAAGCGGASTPSEPVAESTAAAPEATAAVETSTPSPEASPTPTPAMSEAKAAFIAKADAICTATYASMQEAFQKASRGVTPGSPEGLKVMQAYAATALDLVTPMYEEIADLKAPKEDREFLVVYLASAREHAKLARQQLEAAREDRARAELAGVLQQRQKEAAKSYGFTVCDAT